MQVVNGGLNLPPSGGTSRARLRLELLWLAYAAAYGTLAANTSDWPHAIRRPVSTIAILLAGVLVTAMLVQLIRLRAEGRDSPRDLLLVTFGACLFTAHSSTDFGDSVATTIAVGFALLVGSIAWSSDPWSDSARQGCLVVAHTLLAATVAGLLGLGVTLGYKYGLGYAADPSASPVVFHSVAAGAFGTCCATLAGARSLIKDGRMPWVVDLCAPAVYGLLGFTQLHLLLRDNWQVSDVLARVGAGGLAFGSGFAYAHALHGPSVLLAARQLPWRRVVTRCMAAGACVGFVLLVGHLLAGRLDARHLVLEPVNGLIVALGVLVGAHILGRLMPDDTRPR